MSWVWQVFILLFQSTYKWTLVWMTEEFDSMPVCSRVPILSGNVWSQCLVVVGPYIGHVYGLPTLSGKVWLHLPKRCTRSHPVPQVMQHSHKNAFFLNFATLVVKSLQILPQPARLWSNITTVWGASLNPRPPSSTPALAPSHTHTSSFTLPHSY